jgi:hypothetical protein
MTSITQWVEEEIKISEKIQRKSPYNDFNAGRLEVLESIKEELLSSTSSQTEISDEDIEKAARDYDNIVIYGPPLVHFEQGAFWYREQLKNK